MDEYLPGGLGREIGEMYAFSSEFPDEAFGGDTLMKADLEKMGIEVKLTSLKEYVEKEDWVAGGVLLV
jgi:hypothetical protein